MTYDFRALGKIRLEYYAFVYLLLGAMGFFSLFLYMALFLRNSYALSAQNIGLILGSITFLSAVLSWPMGAWVDRLGELRAVRIGMVLYTIFSLALFFSSALWQVVAICLSVGFIRAFNVPATKGLFVAADDGTGRVFRLRFMAVTLSFLAIALITRIWHAENLRLYFLMGAGFCALGIIWSMIPVHVPPHAIQTHKQGRSLPPRQWHALLAIVAFGMLVITLLSQFESNVPLSLQERFGDFGQTVYANNLILAGLATLVIMLIHDRVEARFGKSNSFHTVLLAAIAATLSLFLVFAAQSPMIVYFAILLFAFSEAICFPLLDSLASGLAQGRNRAKVMGFLELRQFAFFIGPFFGGWVFDHHPEALKWVFAALAIGIMPCYLLARELVDRAKRG